MQSLFCWELDALLELDIQQARIVFVSDDHPHHWVANWYRYLTVRWDWADRHFLACYSWGIPLNVFECPVAYQAHADSR